MTGDGYERGEIDEDTLTQLPVAKSHITFRLRRGEDATPWISELVCFLFDAQGEVLQIARGNTPRASSDNRNSVEYFGVDNLVFRRQKAKEVLEKEVLSFSLARIHSSVEVVGCIVSTSEDEIAKSPKLNEFFLSCDLSAYPDEEIAFRPGKDNRVRVLEYCHANISREVRQKNNRIDPTTKQPNYLVVCKLFRNHLSRNEWYFHSICEAGIVRSAINASLQESMQVFLLDIIPEIEIPNRNALTNVMSICAALSCDEFLGIESYFPDNGLKKEDFARIVLFEMMQVRPELQRLSRASALVTLLFEMFEQIDINGDAIVDWEEFTTFCISLGLIATREQDLGTAGMQSTSYRQLSTRTNTRVFPYQISKIKVFAALKRIAIIENKSALVLIYDADLTFLHEINCLEKLVGKDQQIEILDIDHIPAKNALVIASSDHCITIWSIVNATTGAYVFSSKIVNRYPVLFLKWCTPLKRLIAAGAEKFAQLWDIDHQRVDARLSHHSDRISDCLELANTTYFATCSFDHTIAIWDTSTTKVAFTLEGHAQAVLTLDYHQTILLSSGFEHKAYCWSIVTQSLLTTLGGHHQYLIGAKFVSNRFPTSQNSPTMVVTGDAIGHFKLWDVTRCVRSHSTDLAISLQSFDLHTANTCLFRTFACGFTGSSVSAPRSQPPKQKSAENELADIITGNLQLYRFRSVTQSVESAPPRHVAFNAVAKTFVGCVDGVMTVWSANSGAKLEEPIHVRDAEVCGVAFDTPRERKLFIATSDGSIRLYNPITGQLLASSAIHDGIISSLLFCARSCCLISTGYDRSLCISHSSAGKTNVEVLRTVENAHESCITACAYSAAMELVATGDDSGAIHVYDFQKLYLSFICEGHMHDIHALHFHCTVPLLISSDIFGTILIWSTIGVETYTTHPLMQLTLGGPSAAPAALPPRGNGITSICSTAEPHASFIYAASIGGIIFKWDLRALANTARRNGGRGHAMPFEHRFAGTDTFTRRDGYNPLLRVSHKMSVLKLRNGDLDIPTRLAPPPSNPHGNGSSILYCPPASSWKAHDDTISCMQSLPQAGTLYSVSEDGTLKVWDTDQTCIGRICTVVSGDMAAATVSQQQAARNAVDDSTEFSSSAVPWKFSHHMTMDTSQNYATRVASEVIRKVRKLKHKTMQQQRFPPISHGINSPFSSASTNGAIEEHVELPQSSVSPAKTLGPQVYPLPFTKESVRAGIQDGLFGPQESRQLKILAQNRALISALTKTKKNESPESSCFSAEELANMAKKRREWRYAESDPLELAGLRTLKNYPLELHKRQGDASKMSSSSFRALDIELSPFLQERLCDSPPKSTLMKAPKSTPKRKVMTRLETIASLPKLPALDPVNTQFDHNPQSSPDETASTTTDTDSPQKHGHLLINSASEPLLSVQQTEVTQGVVPIGGGSGGSIHANIDRKMKVYEEIISGVDLEELPTDSHRLHRNSQPLLPVAAILASSSPSKNPPSPTKGATRVVQRNRSSSVSSTNSNPFGPFYTVKQVLEFGNILTRFDEDFSGDIDQYEWVRMLQSFRPLFGASELDTTEKLFHSIDKDDSGKISLREILPTIFSKATSEQLQQMRLFIQTHTKGANMKRK